MKNKTLFLCLVICLFGFITVSAQEVKNSNNVKGKYQTIEVARFDVKEGIKFPDESLDAMMKEILNKLKKTEKFKQVIAAGETATEENEARIRLTGTVVKYKPGSQATRYLIGFGAGKTKVIANIKFTDSVTGEVLFEETVDGIVSLGILGGESSGATSGLAKEVADVTKKNFF